MIATANGGLPSRMAGMTNQRMTVKVNPRPSSAVSPRHRPNASTAMTNAANSTHSWLPRSWSTIA